MAGESNGGTVMLPDGVQVGVGRETSQTNAQGAVVQGMVFPITLKGGTTTTVFIPYSEIHDTAKVQELIERRVKAITAITGG